MAHSYWITFFIAQHGNEERRCQELLAAIRPLISGTWWTESVNFLLFDSEYGIDHLAAEVARNIDTDTDLALIAMTSAPQARVIGAVSDKRMFELIPYALPVAGDPVRPLPASPARGM